MIADGRDHPVVLVPEVGVQRRPIADPAIRSSAGSPASRRAVTTNDQFPVPGCSRAPHPRSRPRLAAGQNPRRKRGLSGAELEGEHAGVDLGVEDALAGPRRPEHVDRSSKRGPHLAGIASARGSTAGGRMRRARRRVRRARRPGPGTRPRRRRTRRRCARSPRRASSPPPSATGMAGCRSRDRTAPGEVVTERVGAHDLRGGHVPAADVDRRRVDVDAERVRTRHPRCAARSATAARNLPSPHAGSSTRNVSTFARTGSRNSSVTTLSTIVDDQVVRRVPGAELLAVVRSARPGRPRDGRG